MSDADAIAVRRVPLTEKAKGPEREWLVTNGLGGYASGTVSGPLSRRYHASLVAAQPVPQGRVVMLNLLVERLRVGGDRVIQLGVNSIAAEEAAPDHVTEFRLELGLPVWRFEVDGIVLERSLVMLHGQNTALITWQLIAGAESVELEMPPLVLLTWGPP